MIEEALADEGRHEHNGQPVLAYAYDGQLYCPDCGIPPEAYSKGMPHTVTTPVGEAVLVDTRFVSPVTDETELYDVDTTGDGESLHTVWTRCATCGESLEPGA